MKKIKKAISEFIIFAILLSCFNFSVRAADSFVTATDYENESFVEVVGKTAAAKALVSCMAVTAGSNLESLTDGQIKYNSITVSDAEGNFRFAVPYTGKLADYDFYVNYTGTVEKLTVAAVDKAALVESITESVAELSFPYSQYEKADLEKIAENFYKACDRGAEESDFGTGVWEKLSAIVTYVNSIPLTIDYTRDAFFDNNTDLDSMSDGISSVKCTTHENCKNIVTAMSSEGLGKLFATDKKYYSHDVPLSFDTITGDTKNAVSSEDSYGEISLNVSEDYYEKIVLAANGTAKAPSTAKVTVYYADNTAEIIDEVSAVHSFKTEEKELPTSAELIGEIGAKRNAHVSGTTAETTYGSYKGYLYAYTVYPSEMKKISGITIQGDNIIVYAATAVKKQFGAGELSEMISEIPNEVNIYDKLKIEQISEIISERGESGVANIEKLRNAEKAVSKLTDGLESYEIYVDGTKTSGDGSREKPFATVSEAKAAAKRLPRDLPIDIIIRGGVYNIPETLAFNEEDSGAAGAPITYKAADGEEVIFTTAKEIDISAAKPDPTSAVYQRFGEEVRADIVAVQLSDYGITAPAVPEFGEYYTKKADKYEDIMIYGESGALPVAQYPNGEYAYTTYTDIVAAGDSYNTSITGAGGTIRGFEERINKWESTEGAYIGGFFGADYRYELNSILSVKDKEITLKYPADANIHNLESRRYKVYNIPEELDSPGEWYIDREENVLYIYPTSDKISISASDHGIISGENVSYLNFSGITFDKIRGSAIHFTRDEREIEISDCTFSNIGRNAVYMTGTRAAKVGFYVNGAYGVKLSDNRISNVGGAAVFLYGGNRDTLESAQVEIKGNTIDNVSRYNRNRPAITVNGVGIEVVNNTIYNLPFHAINFKGNENKISYNEIYHTGREVYDAGVIYTGRSQVQRGNEVSYNYIHDFYSDDPDIGHDNVGIYLDDRMCGTHVHHNIIANGSSAVQIGGGQDNTVEYNIIADCGTSFNTKVWTTEPTSTASELETAMGNSLYIAKYPNISLTYKQQKLPARNVIKNNITNSPIDISDKYQASAGYDGEVSGNKECTSDAFVDYAGGDLRVKNTYDIGTGLTESFLMSQIGAGTAKYKNAEFKKIYPEDGAALDNFGGIYLCWERYDDLCEYIVRVAIDSGMENVVLEIDTPYEFAEISNMPTEHDEYWWQVYAVTSAGEVKCGEGAYRLTKGLAAAEADIAPMKPLDISASFNARIIYNSSEQKSTQIGNPSGSAEYAVGDALWEQISENGGVLENRGVIYSIAGKESGNNTVRLQNVETAEVAVTADNYSAFYLAANALGETACSDTTSSAYKDVVLSAEVMYSDGSTGDAQKLEIAKYYSNHYSQEQKPIFKGKTVNSAGNDTNSFLLYAYKIKADPEKTAVGIRLSTSDGTNGSVYIYSLTGEYAYTAEREGAVIINKMLNINSTYTPEGFIKYISGGEEKIKSVPVSEFSEGNYRTVRITLPADVPTDGTARLFIWEKDAMRPLIYPIAP